MLTLLVTETPFEIDFWVTRGDEVAQNREMRRAT